MMLWMLIAFSAVTAFLFRLLPFLVKDSKLLNDQQGNFYRFLSYSSQAMLGVIIYDTAFHRASLGLLIQNFGYMDALKLGLLFIIFIWVAKTKHILPSFFFGLTVYAGVNFFEILT